MFAYTLCPFAITLEVATTLLATAWNWRDVVDRLGDNHPLRPRLLELERRQSQSQSKQRRPGKRSCPSTRGPCIVQMLEPHAEHGLICCH